MYNDGKAALHQKATKESLLNFPVKKLPVGNFFFSPPKIKPPPCM